MTQPDLSTTLDTIFTVIDQHGWKEFAPHLPTNLKNIQDTYGVFDLLKTHILTELPYRLPPDTLKAYSVHDRLLELFLVQCEILTPYKGSLVKLPFLEAAKFIKHMKPVVDTLEAMAGVSQETILSLFKNSGLMGIYIYGMYHWMDDQTPDMAGTIAAFDKALHWGENVAEKIKM